MQDPAERDEHICDTIKEGVDCLKDRDGCFMYTTKFKIAQFVSFHYKLSEENHQSILILFSIFQAKEHGNALHSISLAIKETTKSVGTSLILPKHSPYVKMFNK